MDKKFWMVLHKDDAYVPYRKHETKESAITKAVELVAQTGVAYYILEVTGRVSPFEQSINYLEIP